MNVYDEHKRLLGLIHEQGWFRFSSTDNELLRSLVYGGYVTAQLVARSNGTGTRLVLTSRGVKYLADLNEQSEQAQSALPFRRRSTDVPHGDP